MTQQRPNKQCIGSVVALAKSRTLTSTAQSRHKVEIFQSILRDNFIHDMESFSISCVEAAFGKHNFHINVPLNKLIGIQEIFSGCHLCGPAHWELAVH